MEYINFLREFASIFCPQYHAKTPYTGDPHAAQRPWMMVRRASCRWLPP